MQRRKHSREFKLEAERDILKSRGPFCEGALVRFAFIAKHWEIWPVSWLWGALGVSRSGFHAGAVFPRIRVNARSSPAMC